MRLALGDLLGDAGGVVDGEDRVFVRGCFARRGDFLDGLVGVDGGGGGAAGGAGALGDFWVC